jgi:hypothetical protein
LSPREKLLQRIGDINDFGQRRPLVSLEEFFEGNDDYASIGYNLSDQPSPAEFYQMFASIRNRADVADVLVEVKQMEDPEGWPSTDTIWIITSAATVDVRQWLSERFAPDDVIEGFPQPGSQPGFFGYEVENYKIPQGMKAYGVWWD